MSLGINTDRYPDTIHKKIQTANSILSAFSEDLNLAHIQKIHVFTLPYEQALRPGRPRNAHAVD